MSYLRWILILFLLLVSQATWVPKIRLGGVQPDLFLGIVFLLALRRGPAWGAWTGFALGLLLGVDDPPHLGIDAMALALAGVSLARISRGLDRSNPIVLALLLFLTALSAETVRVVFWSGFDPGSIPFLWLRRALPSAIYTTLFLPLVAWAAAAVLGRKDWLPGAA